MQKRHYKHENRNKMFDLNIIYIFCNSQHRLKIKKSQT